MHTIRTLLGLLLCAIQSCPALAQRAAPDRLPAVLSFEELKQLSEPDSFTGSLAEKAERILNTPFISNAAARLGVKPIHLRDQELGVYIRAAQWNIERGMNLDLIKLIFQDREAFKSKIDRKEYQPGTAGYEEAIRQAEILRNTSILILNEVDLGMPRTELSQRGGRTCRGCTDELCLWCGVFRN